jgi:hypothetical protein
MLSSVIAAQYRLVLKQATALAPDPSQFEAACNEQQTATLNCRKFKTNLPGCRRYSYVGSTEGTAGYGTEGTAGYGTEGTRY